MQKHCEEFLKAGIQTGSLSVGGLFASLLCCQVFKTDSQSKKAQRRFLIRFFLAEILIGGGGMALCGLRKNDTFENCVKYLKKYACSSIFDGMLLTLVFFLGDEFFNHGQQREVFTERLEQIARFPVQTLTT